MTGSCMARTRLGHEYSVAIKPSALRQVPLSRRENRNPSNLHEYATVSSHASVKATISVMWPAI